MDPVPNRKTHLYCGRFKFGDRVFHGNLYDNGDLRWYENTAQDEIARVDPDWDMKTDLWPDERSLKLLQLLHREFTVEGRLPKEDFNFIAKKLLPGKRRRKFAGGPEDLCIRAILLQFFWKELNPQFSPPIPEGTPVTEW